MAFWVLGGGSPLHHRDDDARAASYFDGGKRRGSGNYHAHAGGDDDRYEPHKRAPWGGGGGGGGCCDGDGDGDGDDFVYGHPYGGYELEHQHRHQHHHHGAGDHRRPLLRDSVPVRNLAFLVIREGGYPPSPLPSPSPSPEPTPAFLAPGPGHCPGGAHHAVLGPGPGSVLPPCAAAAAAAMGMERTESGLSISSSASAHDALSSLDDGPDSSADLLAGSGSHLISDLAAAALVRAHLASHRRRLPDSQPERILRALIAPRTRAAAFALDDAALRSIFSAANELFFGGRLARRVAWDWSHPGRQAQWHASHIVGTTALRRCALLGGWETLIVLSSPILRDTRYNRRLLIATFLHEMIHSFMFVVCGPGAARTCGGHTEGFREIAGLIDEWAGREYLRMSDMEADLDNFRGDVDDDVFSPPVDDMGGSLVEPEWRHGHDRGGHIADLQPPPQHARHDDGLVHGEWQWYEREDFGARGPYASGSSPYVY